MARERAGLERSQATSSEMIGMRTLLILLLATLACTTNGWPQRESFREELRCGQQPQEVEAIARRNAGEAWTCAARSGSEVGCNFKVGKTRVWLAFDNGGLRSIEEGEQFGLTGVATWPRLDVCTRQQFRRFVITAPTTAWVGAMMTIDGNEIGRVRYRNDSVYVPLGRHTLRVEKPDMPPVIRELDVTDGQVKEAPEIVLP